MRVLVITALLLGFAIAIPLEDGRGPFGMCDTCHVAVKIAQDFFNDKATPTLLGAAVSDEACAHMECPYQKKKCTALSHSLPSLFIKWFAATATPASMCSDQHVCRGVQPAMQPVGDDSTLCGMCKYVVSRVQGSLNDTSVQEDIKQKLLKICGDLPGDISTNCTDFVNKYEPIITDYINTAEPEKVCELIGTCTSAPASTMTLWTQPPPALPATLVSGLAQMRASTSDARFLAASPNDMCDVCQMAVIEAHSLIQSPTVQEEIVNYTKAICNTMGSSADACRKYVDDYAPIVFNLTAKYLVPDTFCKEIGLCPPSVPFGIQFSLRARLSSILSSLHLTPHHAPPTWHLCNDLLEEWFTSDSAYTLEQAAVV